MSGLQEKLNKGLASTEGTNPSNFRNESLPILPSHPKEEAQSATHGTEKPKLLQSSVPIKGPGPGKQQHRDDTGKRTIGRPLSKGKSCSGEAHRVRKEEDLQRARVQSSRSCYHGQ